MKEFLKYTQEGFRISGYITSFVLASLAVSGLIAFGAYRLTESKFFLVVTLTVFLVASNILFYRRTMSMAERFLGVTPKVPDENNESSLIN